MPYNAITVNKDSTFSNIGSNAEKASIFLTSSQSNVKLINILNGGLYEDNEYSHISMSPLGNILGTVNSEYGNNNTAIYAEGEDTDIIVKSTIDLNGDGGTGLYVNNGAKVILDGTINLNSELTGDAAIRSFGAWVRGKDSKLILNNDAEVNINAERGIGIHIRNGASLEVNGNGSINFADAAEQLSNQIGVLVSGITTANTSVSFDGSSDWELGGYKSILFRIERGASFSTDNITGNVTFSTANAEEGTLFVVTNGKKASDDNIDTVVKQTEFTIGGATTLTIKGDNSTGIRVEGGAKATIDPNATITLDGSDVTLAKVDGLYYSLNSNDGVSSTEETHGYKSTLISSANLNMNDSTAQDITGSKGYHLTNSGILEHYGSIDFLSDNNITAHNTGILIENGGTLNNYAGAEVKVQGIAIDIVNSTSTANIKRLF